MQQELEQLAVLFLEQEHAEAHAFRIKVRILNAAALYEQGALKEFAPKVHRTVGTLKGWQRCNCYTDSELESGVLPTVLVQIATNEPDAVKRSELVQRALRENWTTDEAREVITGKEKHPLTEPVLLRGVQKRPELIDALMDNPETAQAIENAFVRRMAQDRLERQFNAPSTHELPPAASKPSPWAAFNQGIAALALVMDRLRPDAWGELGRSDIEEIREHADRYGKFLAALADAASDRLQQESEGSMA